MVVLGLATPHNEEMKQVRGVDQTPYPSQLHGASLATCSDAESLSRNRKKFLAVRCGSIPEEVQVPRIQIGFLA